MSTKVDYRIPIDNTMRTSRMIFGYDPLAIR